MNPDLSWLIFGAGAIGTYIGGSLALHRQPGGPGHQVVFLERPEVAAEIQQRGLRLNLDGQEHSVSGVHIAGSIEDALSMGPFDAAVFALKSFDTQAALKGLAVHAASLPPFLCLQNGLENEAALEALLGAERVIAGTVTSAVGRRAAGDVVLERKRGLGVAAGHPLSEAVCAALQGAGLNAQLFENAAAMKWSKMLTNLIANATSAILNMTPAEVFAHPGIFRLEMAQQREALAVMRCLGIPVVDLPGTPVKLLAAGVRTLPAVLSQPLLRRSVMRGRGGKMPSFHIDLHAGRGQSEVEYLNGAVVRLGEQCGVPTPANRLLRDILLQLTRGDLPRDSFDHQPEKLLRMV
jgi:2-dehydropantoate 2-reductase